MDKYSRYYGIVVFVAIVVLAGYFCGTSIANTYTALTTAKSELETKQNILNGKRQEKATLEAKINQLKNVNKDIVKKIYSPADSDLGNDTLFFTLYSDLIEMVHANSIKIKSMKYEYNPSSDPFVNGGGGLYFVCNIDMDLVSNYTNLGKLIQDIYQYPYFMKIDKIDIKPYEKDKKILLSSVRLRLYTRTAPEEQEVNADEQQPQG